MISCQHMHCDDPHETTIQIPMFGEHNVPDHDLDYTSDAAFTAALCC